MTYKEVTGDIFKDTTGHEAYMQCIGADFAMNKGIAEQFNERFDTRNLLIKRHHNNLAMTWDKEPEGFCIVEPRHKVYCLVINRDCWDKPGYNNMRKALRSAAKECIADGVSELRIPRVSYGFDQLEWENISQIIQKEFEHTLIDITVYF